jgi:hypothetical protein
MPKNIVARIAPMPDAIFQFLPGAAFSSQLFYLIIRTRISGSSTLDIDLLKNKNVFHHGV